MGKSFSAFNGSTVLFVTISCGCTGVDLVEYRTIRYIPGTGTCTSRAKVLFSKLGCVGVDLQIHCQASGCVLSTLFITYRYSYSALISKSLPSFYCSETYVVS